jgi:hypothetical protein
MIAHNMPGDGVVAAYEELRSHVLAGSPGGPHWGMIVLLREGIAAWIEHHTARGGVAAQAATLLIPRSALPEMLHAEMVHVLAEIVLKRREGKNP